jgi:hypothetical protein
MQHNFRPLSSVARIVLSHNAGNDNQEPQAARGRFSATPNLPDLFRRAADIVDKILRGAKPANIPVAQPT